MIDPNPNVTEEELHALVDGELPAHRRAAVEAWLASHPEDAARVGGWRIQADALRGRYGVVAAEALPRRLRLEQVLRAGRSWRALAAAAVLLAFLGGGLAGWLARGAAGFMPNDLDVLTGEALNAHKLYAVEVRHPVEVPGSERAHLVQWLSKRVGYDLRAPELEKIDLRLVGGRLLPGPTSAAAFFMYEAPSGERFTFYCARASGGETALRYNAEGELGAIFWADRNVGYVVAGPADRDRLQQIAKTAYEQIDAAPAVKTGALQLR
jgi:YD repeat-containing protein